LFFWPFCPRLSSKFVKSAYTVLHDRKIMFFLQKCNMGIRKRRI
jgi:hypothetical protein